MKHTSLLLAILAATTSFAQTSTTIPESAYRRGMPEVLLPPPLPLTKATNEPVFNSAVFRLAYTKAGRPTVAILWNRELTDMLTQSSASQVSIDTTISGNAQSESIRMPGYASTQIRGEKQGNTTITASEVRAQQSIRSAPIESMDLQMRSVFVQTMVNAGVRLVDRNVAMRTTAARQKNGTTPDSQQIEIEALSKHASLLMEILNTPDASSPSGWATYVSIKRLADGAVLAEGYGDGSSIQGNTPQPSVKFEADSRGGFREVVTVQAPIKARDIARAVAELSLALLGEALLR